MGARCSLREEPGCPSPKATSVFSAPILLALLAVGGIIGFISGLLGIGGGSLMIPALVLIFAAVGANADLSTKLAFGTNLLVGCLTALVGFSVHRRHLTAQWPVVLPLAGTSVVGALLGSTLASHLSGHFLRGLFGIVTLLVAAHMMSRPDRVQAEVPRLSFTLLLPLGLLIGFTASLVGLGGAVFTTIILVNVLRYPMRQVVGVSTFVQTAGALFGAVGYSYNGLHQPGLPPYSLGYVNLLAAGVMVLMGVPLARAGARLTHRIDSTVLKRTFAGCLLLIGIAMIWSAR